MAGNQPQCLMPFRSQATFSYDAYHFMLLYNLFSRQKFQKGAMDKIIFIHCLLA